MPVTSNTSVTLGGVAPPGYKANVYYPPQFVAFASGTVTTTSTRLYFVPIYIWQTYTFAGIATSNSGAGDTGDTYRVGVYTDSAGPASLVVDVGEVTLTAAAAARESLASITLNKGFYWLAFHANQAADLDAVNAITMSQADLGTLGLSRSATIFSSTYSLRYVDTAYGALASTAVAPTASTTTVPMMYLKA